MYLARPPDNKWLVPEFAARFSVGKVKQRCKFAVVVIFLSRVIFAKSLLKWTMATSSQVNLPVYVGVEI